MGEQRSRHSRQSPPRGKGPFLDHFSGIRPLQTWNSVLTKKRPRDKWAIFPTRLRSSDESRFCQRKFPPFYSELCDGQQPTNPPAQASKQQQVTSKQASISQFRGRTMRYAGSDPGLIPPKRQGRAEKCAICRRWNPVLGRFLNLRSCAMQCAIT